MKRYKRAALEVSAVQYETGKGLEDGFELWSKVVTNGWITTDNVIQIKREDGTIVSPYIDNKRGRSFIRHGDFIIKEQDGESHVCGAEKFHKRFIPIDET